MNSIYFGTALLIAFTAPAWAGGVHEHAHGNADLHGENTSVASHGGDSHESAVGRS